MFLSDYHGGHIFMRFRPFFNAHVETLFEHPVAFIRIDICCFAAIKISKATLANYLACRDGFVYFYTPAYAGYVNFDKGNRMQV